MAIKFFQAVAFLQSHFWFAADDSAGKNILYIFLGMLDFRIKCALITFILVQSWFADVFFLLLPLLAHLALLYILNLYLCLSQHSLLAGCYCCG